MAGDTKTGVGLSGCKTRIIVVKECNPKTSEDTEKFIGEFAKLSMLCLMASSHKCGFSVPGHLSMDASGRQYSREYIVGETLESQLCSAGWNTTSVAHDIIKILDSIAAGPLLCTSMIDTTDYFLYLLNDSMSSVEEGNTLETWNAIRARIHSADFPKVEFGFNHGDLAFDNIIVDPDRKLWLIDPLVNKIETPWWDVGKVLQSTYCNWPALKAGIVDAPSPGLLSIAENVLLTHDRRTSMFFLMLVLLRIIRHAPKQEQKRAILTEATRIGMEYLEQ